MGLMALKCPDAKDCRYTRYAATFFICFARKSFIFSQLRPKMASRKWHFLRRYMPLQPATFEQIANGN
jgi:hypothetical protein